MDKPTASFCWIRLLSKALATNSFPSELDVAYKKVPDIRTHIGRPPRVAAAGVEEGGAAYWVVDARFSGDPASPTVFDLGPAFASEADAVEWISDKGRSGAWVDEAVDYFLLSTWSKGAFQRIEPTAAGKSTAPGQFPDQDWLEVFRHAHEDNPEVELFKPTDADLQFAKPLPGTQECQALVELAKPGVRTDQRKAEIAEQAQSLLHALKPIFDVVGIELMKPPAPEALRAVALVQQNITRTVFHFKNELNRARPWNTCAGAGLQAMWKKGDRLYPGHSSFPSGHATTAYAWAGYLAGHFRNKADDLMAAARRVAKNREVAGVHFKTDTAAGKELGEKIAARLLRDEQPAELQALRNLANVDEP